MAILETPGKMYALAGVLSVLAVVAVILRFYSRSLLKTARVKMDDFMILPALLFTLGTGFCMFIGAALGDLGRHTMVDAHGVPEFTHRTQVFLQTTFASQLTQTLAFGFTNIFTNGRVVYVIWAMIALVNIWTTSFFFANLLQCFPISVNWIGWGAAVDSCIDTNLMFIAQAWSDVVTDVLILSLPLPCIWQLQMPTSQKIAISGIFLLGTLVVAAGVAKLVVFYDVVAETQTHNNDVTYILTPALYWPMVEASLGVVGACLPSMRPIFRDLSFGSLVHSIRSLIAATSNRSCESSSNIGKADGPWSKSSTRGLCQKCSQNIEAYCDFTAPKMKLKDVSAVYDVNNFDDLPDFPTLADCRRKGRRGVLAENLV